MIKREIIKVFAEEMEKILDEKFEKYQDSWKITNLGILRTKIDEQIQDITNIIIEKIDWDKEKVKRKLIHVANYCLFIFTNLNE